MPHVSKTTRKAIITQSLNMNLLQCGQHMWSSQIAYGPEILEFSVGCHLNRDGVNYRAVTCISHDNKIPYLLSGHFKLLSNDAFHDVCDVCHFGASWWIDYKVKSLSMIVCFWVVGGERFGVKRGGRLFKRVEHKHETIWRLVFIGTIAAFHTSHHLYLAADQSTCDFPIPSNPAENKEVIPGELFHSEEGFEFSLYLVASKPAHCFSSV